MNIFETLLLWCRQEKTILITVSYQLREKFKWILTEDNVKGNSNFIYKQYYKLLL